MKYRKKLDDFIVEEIGEHKIVVHGKFKLYVLEKEGVETFALLESISRNQNIPKSEIGIAGIKDTFAKTKQFVSIPKNYELKNFENVNVKFIGYLNNPIKLGDLIGNKFNITVREIEQHELDQINKNSKLVNYGVPNYFDSQRFGSVVDKKFICKYLVKKDYESAVKHYLTSVVDSDSEQRNAEKEAIYDSWPKFNVKLQSHDLKKVVQAYKDTKKWVVAYKHIQSSLRQLFVSAYQSHIWNECVKELLIKNVSGKDLYSINYTIGELVFSEVEIKNLPKTFQTMSHKIVPKDYEKDILDKVLFEEGVSISEFNIRQTGNFFKTTNREIMMYPKDFEMLKPIKDGSKYNITVSFTLVKGSYATVVLKQIFGQ